MSIEAHQFFELCDALPFATLDDLIGPGGLVVVAPHPDDESLGCGGLIASALEVGRPVRVIVVSDGTGSHPNSKIYPAERLRALREAECRAACAALGLDAAHLSFLGLPDRSTPFEGPQAEAASAAIAAACDAVGASAVAVTWGRDPHWDHQTSCGLTIAAIPRMRTRPRLVQYPVWGHTLPPNTTLDGPPRGFRLDVAAALARKKEAIRAHRSQVTSLIDDDPEGFCLSADMVARFERPFEIYLAE